VTSFSLIDGRAYHCGQIIRRMRAEQREAMLRAGANPHHEIWARFHSSCYCKAWLIDGELAALGGAVGSLGGSECFIWLVTSEKATKHPVAIALAARDQMAHISTMFHTIDATVLAADWPSMGFAAFLGFAVNGQKNPPRLNRRAMLDIVDNASEIRIPFGDTFTVPVRYMEGLS